MPTAAHCKLCGDRHWSYEPHKYPKDLEVRGWAKEFVMSRPSAVPVVPSFTMGDLQRGNDVSVAETHSPVVVSFSAEELDDEGENYVLKECEVCEEEFESKRADARFCSPKCRKKASREAK